MTDAPHDAAESEKLRDRATHALDDARTLASDAVETSRERAREAAKTTAEAIESNPIGMLVGGLALGVLVGALVPRSQRERELMAPVGKRVGVAAAAALAAAKEAGKSELDNIGLSKDAAREQVKSLFQGALKAASSAGSAAAQAGRENIKSGA